MPEEAKLHGKPRGVRFAAMDAHEFEIDRGEDVELGDLPGVAG